MPEGVGKIWFSWDLVFKLASLVILIFGGLSIEQVGRAITHVQTETKEARNAATQAEARTTRIADTVRETNRKVALQETIAQEQTVLTAQQAEILAQLMPRFTDVAERQHHILGSIADVMQVNKRIVQNHESFMGIAERVHHDLENLSQTLQVLHQEVQALKPPPAPTEAGPRP